MPLQDSSAELSSGIGTPVQPDTGAGKVLDGDKVLDTSQYD